MEVTQISNSSQKSSEIVEKVENWTFTSSSSSNVFRVYMSRGESSARNPHGIFSSTPPQKSSGTMRRWKTGHFASWSEASCCYLLRLVQENHTPQGTGTGLAREWSAGGALVNENPLRRPDGTSAQEWSYHGRCRNAITDARTPW